MIITTMVSINWWDAIWSGITWFLYALYCFFAVVISSPYLIILAIIVIAGTVIGKRRHR